MEIGALINYQMLIDKSINFFDHHGTKDHTISHKNFTFFLRLNHIV